MVSVLPWVATRPQSSGSGLVSLVFVLFVFSSHPPWVFYNLSFLSHALHSRLFGCVLHSGCSSSWFEPCIRFPRCPVLAALVSGSRATLGAWFVSVFILVGTPGGWSPSSLFVVLAPCGHNASTGGSAFFGFFLRPCFWFGSFSRLAPLFR